MRWFKKQADKGSTGGGLVVVPEPLQVTFNKEIVGIKLASLNESLAETRGTNGIESFVEALQSKHEVFAGICSKGDGVDITDLQTLGGLSFTIRRKLGGILADSGSLVLEGFHALISSNEMPVENRIRQFADLAMTDKKRRRALWDFASEVMHFREPERIPLVNRWVWDASTMSGALREFIKANDTMRHIPIGDSVAAIEGARSWFYDALTEEGFYRDLHWMVNLVWAQAYSDYARSLSMSMGMVDAQFGARQDPLELLVKLLGIDSPEGRLKSEVNVNRLH